jgi:hypothetical protein
MRPAVLTPLIVFLALFVGMAWVEYSQHSGLMLQAASADVAQLCANLKSARLCPESQRFPTREAKDPWSHSYQCRPTPSGLLIYTMGADDEVGGSRRDADIVCKSAFRGSASDHDEPEACACVIGDDATALLE